MHFGGFLETYNQPSDLTDYQDSLTKEDRVAFFPYLQPYAFREDQAWAGWDQNQSSFRFSSLPQWGRGNDSYSRNYVNLLNRCLIYQSCNPDSLETILHRGGVDEVVFQKNLISRYQSFSHLGQDKRAEEIYNSADYNSLLRSNLGSFDTQSESFNAYNNLDSLSLFTGSNDALQVVGGVTAFQDSEFTDNLVLPVAKKNIDIDTSEPVLIQNNRTSLINLESDPDTVLLEPGFFVNDFKWQKYHDIWWQERFAESGYNGVFTNFSEAEIELGFTTAKDQEYQVFLVFGNQDEAEESEIEISFNDSNKVFKVENTKQSRLNKEAIFSTDLSSGRNTLNLKNVKGTTSLAAIFLQPADSNIIKDVDTYYYLNDDNSLLKPADNTNTIEFNVEEVVVASSFLEDNKFSLNTLNNNFSSTINFKVDEDGGNFVSYELPLPKGITIADFNQFNEFNFDYKTSSKEDTFIDVSINIGTSTDPEIVLISRLRESDGSTIIIDEDIQEKIKNQTGLDLREDEVGDVKVDSLFLFYNKNPDTNPAPEYTFSVDNISFSKNPGRLLDPEYKINFASLFEVDLSKEESLNNITQQVTALKSGSYSVINRFTKGATTRGDIELVEGDNSINIEAPSELGSDTLDYKYSIFLPLNTNLSKQQSLEYTEVDINNYKVSNNQYKFISFNQSFDLDWRLEGKSPVRGNFIFNTFEVNGDNLELVYAVNSYRRAGIYIAGLTFLVSIFTLLVGRLFRDKNKTKPTLETKILER